MQIKMSNRSIELTLYLILNYYFIKAALVSSGMAWLARQPAIAVV
jgi:hypothetical protein